MVSFLFINYGLMNRFLTGLALAFLLVHCTPKKEKIPPINTMQKSSGKIVIYQMMTRLFGNKISVNKPWGSIEENGVGKFNDIDNKALAAIKEMGISHIWYTGVLEH